MAELQVLGYEDFLARIRQIALERQAWSERSAISLPALGGELARTATGENFLLTFLYQAPDARLPDSGFLPYAVVQIRPDGELMQWSGLPQSGEIARGQSRFRGDAAEMNDRERRAFLETYYTLLVGPEGPMRERARANPEIMKDVKLLFDTFAEEPLLPLYRRYAREFLRMIGSLE